MIVAGPNGAVPYWAPKCCRVQRSLWKTTQIEVSLFVYCVSKSATATIYPSNYTNNCYDTDLQGTTLVLTLCK